jgi:hypothetical protein
MPGLLDAVKAAVAREANQLFDKLAFVASKVGMPVQWFQVVEFACSDCLGARRAGHSSVCCQQRAAVCCCLWHLCKYRGCPTIGCEHCGSLVAHSPALPAVS